MATERKTPKTDRAARKELTRLVCIGASAGGLHALSQLVGALKQPFPGTILIVVHTSGFSWLPSILSRHSRLSIAFASDGQPLRPGLVLVAPPDNHLLLNDHHVVLSRGPRQNNVRPAIDPLFKAAARTFGPATIGVILSGTLDDGSAGLAEIKRVGGVAIVQSPEDAEFPDMPRHALEAVKPDFVLPAARIGARLNRLVHAHGSSSRRARTRATTPHAKAVQRGGTELGSRPPGRVTTLTCPECGGTLWEKREGNTLHFLCHTGHGFSASSLMTAQNIGVENALWVALRTLKERAMLVGKFARIALRDGRRQAQAHYLAEEQDLKLRIEALRRVLLSGQLPYTPALNPEPRARKKGKA